MSSALVRVIASYKPDDTISQEYSCRNRTVRERSGPRGVGVRVSSRENGVFDLALNNAVNLAREYSNQAEELEVEIVAYGPGLHMLRADTSPVTSRIHSITESVPGIVLSACGNTIKAMEKAEGHPLELLPHVGIVSAGAVRLVALQEAGWSYLRV